jgi:hypothetical protein
LAALFWEIDKAKSKGPKTAPFSMAEERALIELAAKAATLEHAASKLRRPAKTIEAKCRQLGIPLKNGRLAKRDCYLTPTRF